MDLKNLAHIDLLQLLFEYNDNLPRSIIDEFVNRGEEMIYPLWQIIKETYNWQGEESKGWATIHATFILAAIGGRKSIIPLITSLRQADANECDWVLEPMPSIFGSIGPDVIEPLCTLVLDQSNSCWVRICAMDGMAAVTLKHPELGREIFDFIASILKDQSEDMIVRGSAGSILLDFKQEIYKKSLLSFVEEDEEMSASDPYHLRFFDTDYVYERLENKEFRQDDLWHYKQDWLEFYSPNEIDSRQKRWQRGNSFTEKIKSKLFFWKLMTGLKKIKEKFVKNK